MYGSTLQHVGVLGMHWGVHRGGPKSVSVAHPDHTSAHDLTKKKLHELSNAEIQKYAARINLENQYRTLNPSKQARGKKSVEKAIKVISATTATATTLIAGYKMAKVLIEMAKTRTVI